MEKPVVIEYRTGILSGARYVVVSASKADEVHPEAVIVAYEDGTPYEAVATKAKRKREDGDEPVDWSAVRTYVLEDDGTTREALP